jgi:hypothetical protein
VADVPRRRRTPKHRPAADLAEMFLHSDGVAPLFDGDPVFDNAFLARAAWQGVRTLTWQHEFRGERPPTGAVVYDDVGDELLEFHPIGHPSEWSSAAVCARYERDVASVEAFRLEHPRETLEIRDELDAYVADLKSLFSIAVELDFDPCAARWPWSEYLVGRQPTVKT